MRKRVISILLTAVLAASVSVAALADGEPAVPEIEEIAVEEIAVEEIAVEEIPSAPENEEPAAPAEAAELEEQFAEFVAGIPALTAEAAELDGEVDPMVLEIVPVSGEAKVAQTKTIQFAVKVKSNPLPFCALGIGLAPSDTGFTFVNAVCNLKSNSPDSICVINEETGILIWVNDTYADHKPEVGDTLVTFTLKAKENAALGNHSIDVAFINVAGFESGKYVATETYAPCTVEVTAKPPYILGDVDGNGSIQPKDYTILFRYLKGWSGITIDEDASDIDGNGSVQPKDYTLLFRYLKGWDVPQLSGN